MSANMPLGVLPRTQALATVGGLDLDGAHRYAQRCQAQWAELQRRIFAADRKLCTAEQSLADQVGHGELSIEVSMAYAAVRAAREALGA